MKVFIIGAGPAGLSVVDELAKRSNFDFVVIEAESCIGGMAKTVKWKDYGYHDLGPHKIFTLNKELLDRVLGLIPMNDWLKRPKKSTIFINKHFIGYPPSPFALLRVYGLFRFVKIIFSFAIAKILSILNLKEVKTYEDDIKLRVGNELYKIFFNPIARKLWADPSLLDITLSKGRVQTPSIIEVIFRILGLSKKSKFEALDFYYPKGGLQKIWESIYNASASKGVFKLGEGLVSVDINGKRIAKLITKGKSGGKINEYIVGEEDFVFSTIPVKSFVSCIKKPIFSEQEMKKISDKIVLNDLILVFIRIDKNNLIDESWVFIPELDIAFHRLSEQESFDPSMSKDCSIVCCEVMSRKDREFIDKTDAQILNICLFGMQSMGFDIKVQDFTVYRLPEAYPVYRSGYNDVLNMVIGRLDGLDNLRSIGRQGAFNYIGTLDAMDIGYGAARWLKDFVSSGDNNLWYKERERTSFFPVLD